MYTFWQFQQLPTESLERLSRTMSLQSQDAQIKPQTVQKSKSKKWRNEAQQSVYYDNKEHMR